MKYHDGYEPPDDVDGFIYVFKCGPHYKIGFSKDPAKRRKQLATGSPLRVELVHRFWTPFCRQIERRLHRKFKEKRGSGEWFTLSEADVAHIKTIDKWGLSDGDRARQAQEAREHAEQRQRNMQEREEMMKAPSRIDAVLLSIERQFHASGRNQGSVRRGA